MKQGKFFAKNCLVREHESQNTIVHGAARISGHSNYVDLLKLCECYRDMQYGYGTAILWPFRICTNFKFETTNKVYRHV